LINSPGSTFERVCARRDQESDVPPDLVHVSDRLPA
jgi:hypothetical protein